MGQPAPPSSCPEPPLNPALPALVFCLLRPPQCRVKSSTPGPRGSWPGQHRPPSFNVQSASPSPDTHTASSPRSWGERAFLPLSPHPSAPQGSPTSGLPEVRWRSLHSAYQADDTVRKFLLQAGPNPGWLSCCGFSGPGCV